MLLRARQISLALLLPLLACRHATVGPVDGGLTIDLSDGGARTGHLDAGPPHDGGMITLPDSGPTPLRLQALSPARGPVSGGTPVTLSGAGFNSGLAPTDPAAAALATSVSFGGNPVLGVTVLADGTLQVFSPAGVAGPADVTIANPNGEVTCTGCFDFLAPIEIDQVAPPTGPLVGGTPITVSGLGFDGQTVLLIGSRAVIQTHAISSTQLTGLTPPGSVAGAVDVRAFNRNGAALLHAAFRYLAIPSATSVSPPAGPIAGGTPVTLSGAGFLGESVSVTIGGAPATPVSVLDDATVRFLTPAGAVGPADVVVTDAQGSAQLVGAFVYVDPTSLSFSLLGVVPRSGPQAGSASVALVGTGFPATGFAVGFGAAAPGFATVDSSNLATVAVPAGPPGVVAVVADAGGTLASLPAGYTYLAPRDVTGIAPAVGPSAGGTPVQISGDGFALGDQVFVGALPATAVNVASPTQISAITPAGSAGPVDVRVISAGGGNPALLPAGFVYQDPFALIQVSPASGSQAGGTDVQLLGTGFGLGNSALFGAAAATDVQLLDSYTLACHTPPGAPGAVAVTLALAADAGTSVLADGFSYFDPTNNAGGQNGGPLDGTLNVTVLSDSPYSYGVPIPGATVRLGLDPQTPFQGTTDSNGQITFSDPTLVKAQTVTALAQGTAATIANVTRQNLTLFLDLAEGRGGMAPSACPCTKNGQPPDCPTNCGVPFCSILGVCVQCLSDADCQNPGNPGYSPTRPHCNPPGGIGGACVTCISDSDCARDPSGNRACDNSRGNASTYTCVQCTNSTFCPSTSYCNASTVSCIAADEIAGSVYGFKLPPGVTLTATQRAEARVGLLVPSVYNLEPFQPNPSEFVVLQEGGAFGFQIDANALNVSLYAKFGIADSLDGSFTPLLLGVLRGVAVDPTHPAVNLSLLLDTHLDQSAPIQISNQLSPPPQVFFLGDGGLGGNGNPVTYDTFAYLDLGQDGIVPLSDVVSQSTSATLTGLPPVQGNGVLFLTQAFQSPPAPLSFSDPTQRSPFSAFFRRVSTDFTQGVPLGPLLPFVQPVHPANGALLDGTFQWSFAGSVPPEGPPDVTRIDIVYVQVDSTGKQSPGSELWQIVVPGTQTQVQLPLDAVAQLLATVPQSQPGLRTYLFWQINTAHAPRFDFNFFSYTDLSQNSWTSFQTTQSLAAP